MCVHAKKAFSLLVQKVRRDFGQFEYLLVWELTKKGTPHIHLLQRGVFIPKQKLSDMWCKLTGSFIVDMKRIRRDSEVARYMTKYMGKSIADSAEKLHGLRILQKSKNYVLTELPEELGKDQSLVIEIDNWIFCSATPREIIEAASEFFDCTLEETSTPTCLELRGPPDPDLLMKIVHHFDDSRSYV